MKDRLLSGEGYIGFLCPKCKGELQLIREMFAFNWAMRNEIYACSRCMAPFEVTYEVKGWKELPIPPDLERG